MSTFCSTQKVARGRPFYLNSNWLIKNSKEAWACHIKTSCILKIWHWEVPAHVLQCEVNITWKALHNSFNPTSEEFGKNGKAVPHCHRHGIWKSIFCLSQNLLARQLLTITGMEPPARRFCKRQKMLFRMFVLPCSNPLDMIHPASESRSRVSIGDSATMQTNNIVILLLSTTAGFVLFSACCGAWGWVHAQITQKI